MTFRRIRCSSTLSARTAARASSAAARPANCGLCTVYSWTSTPILSCSMLAARASGRSVTTLEGLQERSRRVRRVYRRPGRGAVRLLQPRLHYERARAVPREESRPDERDQGVPRRQPVPLLRLRGSAARHTRASSHGKRQNGGERKHEGRKSRPCARRTPCSS